MESGRPAYLLADGHRPRHVSDAVTTSQNGVRTVTYASYSDCGDTAECRRGYFLSCVADRTSWRHAFP